MCKDTSNKRISVYWASVDVNKLLTICVYTYSMYHKRMVLIRVWYRTPTCEMVTNATMTCQYKWPPNNLYVYPMKLKYGLKDSL